MRELRGSGIRKGSRREWADGRKRETEKKNEREEGSGGNE